MIVRRPVGADDTAALARGLWAYLAKKGGIKKRSNEFGVPRVGLKPTTFRLEV